MEVVDVGVILSSVMCVIGHRDYSLTLIGCDSRRSSVIGLMGNQGIGCDFVVG